MTNQLSQINWKRTLITALVVYFIGFLITFLVVTVYAMVLAFQARGAPDQTMIQAFANRYAPLVGPTSLILFTILGARHLARRVEDAIPLHGTILGLLTSLVNLAFDGLSPGAFAVVILTVAAGWLGSKLGNRK